MQEILAGWLGIEVGSYNHYSDSLHLHSCDVNKIGVGQEDYLENQDCLSIPQMESDKIFVEIYDRMQELAQGSVTESDIGSLAKLDSRYVAYDNIMLMIAAYAAYKERNHDLAGDLVEKCTNKMYTAMWYRWINEREKRIQKGIM